MFFKLLFSCIVFEKSVNSWSIAFKELSMSVFLLCKGIGFFFGTEIESSLTRCLDLKAIKDIINNFHPPQFFSYLHTESPLLHTLSESI